MAVDPDLLQILACPVDRAPLRDTLTHLVCTSCGRRYPIREGIPVMLVDEAELPASS
ncbi:MAG: Trm112 family protein [Chloroflexota bacterium]|nr:Trm112 family protein [Chloroflexota bacterium]